MRASCSSRSAPAKARCRSSNAAMGELRVHDAFGLRGLLEEQSERRHIRVPLDERGQAPEKGYRVGVKRPHLGTHARAVIVDADRATVLEAAQLVAGKMDFADAFSRQAAQIVTSVEAVVARAHENVVDIAQDATVSARGDL